MFNLIVKNGLIAISNYIYILYNSVKSSRKKSKGLPKVSSSLAWLTELNLPNCFLQKNKEKFLKMYTVKS